MLYTNTKLQREIMTAHARAMSMLNAAKVSAAGADDAGRKEFLKEAADHAETWAKLIRQAVSSDAACPRRRSGIAATKTQAQAAEPTRRKTKR